MKVIKGDLLSMAKRSHFDVIAHGANCMGIFGAGIAKQIAEQFPDCAVIDKQYYEEHAKEHENMMGNYSWFWCNMYEHPFNILNLYTQLYPGLPSPGCKIPFDYAAFTTVLRKVNQRFKGKSIGLPYIGCGLGGASAIEVSDIIEKELFNMRVTMVIYEPNGQMAGAGLGDDIPTRKESYTGSKYGTGADGMGNAHDAHQEFFGNQRKGPGFTKGW